VGVVPGSVVVPPADLGLPLHPLRVKISAIKKAAILAEFMVT
jgi:hypothetical protein